jgi:hypothetical protein
MPTIDHDAERRRLNRALALSRKKGDFVTLDGPVTRLASAAEVAAAKKREWEREFERKYLSYW